MTHDQYLELSAINATAIKAGRLSMKHMRHAMTVRDSGDTPAFRWGRLVHLAVLEPDEISRKLFVFDGRRAGKEWEAVKADHDERWIVKLTEMSELMAISSAVHADPDAHRLIDSTFHEHTVTWEGPYGSAKARLDMWHPEKRIVGELKTTARIDKRSFANQCASLGYDMQGGWYGEPEVVAGRDLPEFLVVAVESDPPHDVIVYRMPRDVVEMGRLNARTIALKYRCCESSNCWPGVGEERGIIDMEWPVWAGGERDIDVSIGSMGASEL